MKVFINWVVFIAVVLNILALLFTGDAYLPENF